MTPHEIIQEIKHFSVDEKALIIEQISHSLRTDLQAHNKKAPSENDSDQLSIAERMAIVESLHGCLRNDAVSHPSNRQEEKEMYLEHLLEKYS